MRTENLHSRKNSRSTKSFEESLPTDLAFPCYLSAVAWPLLYFCKARCDNDAVCQVKMLREESRYYKDEAQDERRKRLDTKITLTKDLEEIDRACHEKMRRVASLHNLSTLHKERVSQPHSVQF